MMSVDRRNTERLKEIVAAHGWPTRKMVGSDGARCAWLLAQHADHDVAWQRKALGLMEALRAEADPVFLTDLAYLTDRVRVNEGMPQIYGTQGLRVDGVWQPRPLEEPDKVDERRASMGMKSLEEYKAFMHT